jgi:pimeloyl-ACP methyl ester carboxylesterase
MPTEELESEKRSPAAPVSKPVRRLAGLRRIGAAFAWLAGVGAILGGLTGYWSTYRTVTTELLTPAASKPMVTRFSIAVLQAFLYDFAGDLPPEEARVLYAVQQPFKKSLTTEKTTNAAWRTKPTFYAVSTQDRTINPDLERFMAKRMGAKTIEIKASHLALISHPDAITNLILEALAV